MPVSIYGSGLITSGNISSINVTKVSSNAARYTRQVLTRVDSASYSFNTSWAVGPTFADISDFRAGSLIRLFYYMPCRNDDSGWGGLYFEPQYRINSGTWISLGSCGYTAVMTSAGADIGFYSNTILLDPAQTDTFTLGIRFYVKTYSGTTGSVNSSNELTTISGTATLATGTNGTQHYAHIILEELALLRGDL